MIRRLCPAAVFALSACVGAPARPAVDAAAPAFAPIAFFAGRTAGDGRLKVVLSRERAVRVASQGEIGPDGTLTLVQHIEEEGKPPRTRRWSLRPTDHGFAAELSDAVGPAAVTVSGNVLHIRFKARGGLAMEQWLAVQPGGRTARNQLVVRKFGMRVAVLDETIRRID